MTPSFHSAPTGNEFYLFISFKHQLMISFCLSQLDGNGDGEPGVLMTAQTITSESLCTTTTTHITKVRTDTHPKTHTRSFLLSLCLCDIA